MPRDLILGTAGHIDHGKTALVKALTGIDCDRLPEEKARGITIDIGFAILDLGEFRVGIVDLPGHERFIMNMLAGATGIDLALLVVAADDSVMPQTREHLEILRLLGLRHGVIALTKADLVDDTTRAVVEMEIRELVKDSFLAEAPIVPTSVHTGAGLEALTAALRDVCDRVESGRADGWFRMAIDRSFVVQGYGTVVTGSVTSGSVCEGAELDWLPGGERVRVRSLQNHDQSVTEVHRGMRAALNLAGVPHEQVIRGQELAEPGYLVPSRVVTVRLHCLADSRRPIKHRMNLRFHVGASEIMATASLLDCDAIEPGQWGLAQLFLEKPAVTTWGQPFIVRESAATCTLGGGQVLQPTARKIRRRHIEILERIERLWSGDPAERVQIAAWFGGLAGFNVADLVRGAGVGPSAAAALVAELKEQGKLVDLGTHAEKPLLLHIDVVGEIETRIMQTLERLHGEAPLVSAHPRQRITALLDYLGAEALVLACLERLIGLGKVVGDQRRVALANFKPQLSNNQRKLRDKIIASHQEAGFQPPDPASFAGAAGGNAAGLNDLFEVCVAEGRLCKISDGVYLHADAEAQMRRLMADKLASDKGLTVAEIRDLLGTTRKYAVPFCEYLDRIGLTRREGNLRVSASTAAISGG